MTTLDRIIRRLPVALRRFYCEIFGHRSYHAPSGLFSYCLRCHTTFRSST